MNLSSIFSDAEEFNVTTTLLGDRDRDLLSDNFTVTAAAAVKLTSLESKSMGKCSVFSLR